MMRSTRQESVFVNARRSRGSCVRSRSSSVTALRCEPLECCDMVVLHVVEEWGEADVAGPRVRDDPGGREVAHPIRRIVGGEHHDRSEEHTSELQSLAYLVCRLLLEKKKSN